MYDLMSVSGKFPFIYLIKSHINRIAKESHYLNVFGIIPLGLKNKHYLQLRKECATLCDRNEKALDDNLNGKLLHYLNSSNTYNNKHNERMNTNNLMCIHSTRVRVMCVLIDNGSVDIFFANNRSC